jgi:hypothetical protein
MKELKDALGMEIYAGSVVAYVAHRYGGHTLAFGQVMERDPEDPRGYGILLKTRKPHSRGYTLVLLDELSAKNMLVICPTSYTNAIEKLVAAPRPKGGFGLR